MSSTALTRLSLRRRWLNLARQRQLWGIVFTLIPALLFFIINIMPMFFSFRLSLLDYNPLREVNPFVGLRNYRDILGDRVFQIALWNTFKFVLLRVPVTMVLALGIAFLLHKVTRGKGFLRILYLLPWVTSPVAVAWVWKWAYNSTNGPINNALEALGQSRQNFLWNPDLVLLSIAIVSIWQGLGYYTIIYAAGLEGIPDIYYEAARIDGASGWQVFRYVTLPLLNSTTVLIFILCTIGSLHQFATFRNMTMEGRGGPLNAGLVISLLIYMESFTALRMGRGAAMTVVFLIITLVLTALQIRYSPKEVEY